MERGMSLVGERPSVTSAPHCELDTAQELDVGAIIELIGMAGGRVADQEPERASVLVAETAATVMIDDNALDLDRTKRDRDVEIVPVGVQG
jgi:hypothetical protein